MGQQQSKDELLYQAAISGHAEGIRALHSEGAGLEWIDKEGKTPLIVASMNPDLYNVAKTLIESGANVNAYRPGRHAGTPLHHAAKRGLEPMVKLLLSQGANALLMNDDCQTALDVARVKGFSNVVRAIESHICLFSGWMRELHGPKFLQELNGPSFLEVLAREFITRKVWVVVLPCGSRNLSKPLKLELAVYNTSQEAQPHTIIALWKANMEAPNFNLPDPSVVIAVISNIPRRWRRRRGILSSQVMRIGPRGCRQSRIKLAPGDGNDIQQLQWFCNTCKGIPRAMCLSPCNAQPPTVAATALPTAEDDVEMAMAISASLHSITQDIPQSPPVASTCCGHSVNTSPTVATGLAQTKTQPISETPDHFSLDNPGPSPIPTAPPLVDEPAEVGPINYPSIDSSPVDFPKPSGVKADEKRGASGDSPSCVICLDNPIEGACIPCGHMAACMSCLNEIKARKWGCPVCRAKIEQVVRLYAV